MAGRLWSSAVLTVLSASAVAGFDFDGCTTIVVGSAATVDGSAIVSHANDCADCDWRMIHVPMRHHKKGALRPILDAARSPYPRFVDPSRSPQYLPGAGINESLVLGYIPEVKKTYALYENAYSLMNEKGLAMGESTCAAFMVGNRTAGKPEQEKEHSYKDGALFSIGNLMSIALERCETARCAVQTMGDLGMKYGFYGEDPGMPGAGEVATVADAKGETWVFHIAGGLPESRGSKWEGKRGALWAAQRVQAGHVAVVANNFIIREVRMEDKENFVVHPGLFHLAKEAGLWDGEGDFDFLKVMAPDMRHFSYTPGLPPIPLYTTLRMWHVFNSVAPSLNLMITDLAWNYPFSVKVDKKLSHLDVMDLFRSHYEGTEFDMRLGVLAGPFQSPNRAEGGRGMSLNGGQYARALSIPRTSYTQVSQTAIKYPKVWFAPDGSASSVFVPFYASVLAHADGKFDVAAYGEGSSKKFDFKAAVKPAWWAFDFVANWMEMNYQNMSETYVLPKMQRMQREVNDAVVAAEARAEKAATKKSAASMLAEEQTRIQHHVTEEWWELAGMLVARYNDYFFNWGENNPDGVTVLGYPAWWLEMVGFGGRSFFPNWVKPSNVLPSLLPHEARKIAMAAMDPSAVNLGADDYAAPVNAATVPSTPTVLTGWMAGTAAALVGMVASGLVGYRLGKQHGAKAEDGYVPIVE